MTTPASLRDSTQIVIGWETLNRVGIDPESEFTVTVSDEGEMARIIGSPAEIKDLGVLLARNGVSLP